MRSGTIAPDAWQKYEISGCGAHEIAVPNPAADARLLTKRRRTTFVNYLRISLRWAGFPKLEQMAGDQRQTQTLCAVPLFVRLD